jgi:hypothetical protein
MSPCSVQHLLLMVMLKTVRMPRMLLLLLVMMMMHHSLAEPLVLAQRRRRRERLAALVALDLLTAIGVHPLVPAEIRELGIGLETNLALERLDARVDVLVLLETAGRRERLAALGARVRARADVRRTDVALQVARVGEHLVAGFAGERLRLLERLQRSPCGGMVRQTQGSVAVAVGTTTIL